MVPGMSERERLATELRRLEWLADARLASLAPDHKPRQPTATPGDRAVLPLGLWRRGLASASGLRRRLRQFRPGSARPMPQ